MMEKSGRTIANAIVTTALVVFLLTASFANMVSPVAGDEGPTPVNNSSSVDVSNSSSRNISYSLAPPDVGPIEEVPQSLVDAGANVSFIRNCTAIEAMPGPPANIKAVIDRDAYDPLDNVTLFVYSPSSLPSAYKVDLDGNFSRLNLTAFGGGYFSVIAPGPPAQGNYTILARAIGPDRNVSLVNITFTVRDNSTDAVEDTHNANPNIVGDKADGNGKKDNGKDKSEGIEYAIYDPAQKVVILKNDSGDALVPANNESMDKINIQYGVDRNLTRATMTSTISSDGKTLHISLDNKTDGCWYKLSAPIPAGYQVLGVYRDNGSTIPGKRDLNINRNTSQDLPGWYVENNTIYFYDDPSSGYDVLMGQTMGLLGAGTPATLNKTLYLWPTPSLNTSMYSGNGQTDMVVPLIGSVTTTWTLTPNFAKDFTVKDPVTADIYYSKSGLLSLLCTVSFSLYNVGSSRQLIASYSSSSLLLLGGGAIGLLSISFSNVDTRYNNVQAGHHLELDIKFSGVLSLYTISIYQSQTYPSKIDMDTDTYINVDDTRIRASNNSIITSTYTPATIKAWANVSDPFGSYDINNVNATLYYPNGTRFLDTTAMSRTYRSTAWANYSADFSLPREIDGGYYNLYTWATETNGIQSYNSTTFYVYGPPLVNVNKTIAYASGNSYTVTLKVKNFRNWEARTVYVYDFYPTGTNGFTTSNFNPSGSYPTTSVNYNVGGNNINGSVVSIGPFNLPAQGMTTITYTITGSGNYNMSNLYIVGVDPP